MESLWHCEGLLHLSMDDVFPHTVETWMPLGGFSNDFVLSGAVAVCAARFGMHIQYPTLADISSCLAANKSCELGMVERVKRLEALSLWFPGTKLAFNSAFLKEFEYCAYQCVGWTMPWLVCDKAARCLMPFRLYKTDQHKQYQPRERVIRAVHAFVAMNSRLPLASRSGIKTWKRFMRAVHLYLNHYAHMWYEWEAIVRGFFAAFANQDADQVARRIFSNQPAMVIMPHEVTVDDLICRAEFHDARGCGLCAMMYGLAELTTRVYKTSQALRNFGFVTGTDGRDYRVDMYLQLCMDKFRNFSCDFYSLRNCGFRLRLIFMELAINLPPAQLDLVAATVVHWCSVVIPSEHMRTFANEQRRWSTARQAWIAATVCC